MSQTYIEYTFKIIPITPWADILIAELGAVGFESFIENEKGVTAYIQKNQWSDSLLNDIHLLSNEIVEVSYTFKEIEQVNWNIEWEKNFDPILVDNICSVRAPFHEKPITKYDIVIEPKMSFGTGHHETTHMMIQHLLKLEIKNKKILDMGCGTGVLAILSAMKGASEVDAIDIDHWCYLNTLENIERNSSDQIKVLEGDASLLKDKSYDIIIANINRNILLKDIAVYSRCLNKNGILLLSGFYDDDFELIENECRKYTLKFAEKIKKNSWIAVKYIN